jgi:hypothetical protein
MTRQKKKFRQNKLWTHLLNKKKARRLMLHVSGKEDSLLWFGPHRTKLSKIPN